MNTPKRFLSLLLNCAIVVASCEKDDDSSALPTSTKAPIARAGADTTIALASCYDKVESIDLDGSKSSDPENDIDIYRWRKIIGPDGDTLLNVTFTKARVVNLSPGYYTYELLVMDVGRRTSRDTVAITITAPVQAYDFDITFSTTFNFKNNLNGCSPWDYGPCPYYDVTEIEGEGSFAPLSPYFFLSMVENADTATRSDSVVNNYISVYTNDGRYLFGAGSVNFKKLIREGGGAFNGSLHVMHSSAQQCNSSITGNIAPLTLTGALDTATKAVNLRIRGKAYF